MKRITLNLLKANLLLLLMSWSVITVAQTKSVSGVVRDASDGIGLPGATIQEKGTTNGTITDMDGRYSLTVSDNAVLIISFVGYQTVEESVAGRTIIEVSLGVDFAELEEIVVIGYGETTTKELTGAVSQIKSDAVVQRKVPRVDQALQGQISGVNITTNSGAPGGTSNIRIRGLSTNGDNDPLILVDGVVYDSEGLNALNPSDIASINVLKDATAGIYGVRAANGVIIIETKKGSLNSKPSFEFNGYYGVQETARKLDLLTAREYAILKNEAFAAGGQNLLYNNVELGRGTDWQDEIFQKVPIQNYNLGVSGGSGNTSYNIGGSYFSQQGIVGGDKAQFDRYNARVNFITELAPSLKFTNVLLYTHEESNSVPQGGIGSVLYNTINAYPTEPIRVEGRYSYLDNIADVINPLAQVENTFNWNYVNKITGKQELSYDFLEDFTLNGRVGYNYAIVDGKTFNPLVWYGDGKFANTAANEDLDPVIQSIGTDVELERGASVNEYRNTYLDYNLEAFVNYKHTFSNSHTVKGTLGATLFGNNSEGLNGTAFNIPNNSLELADISANQAANGYLNNVGSFQVKSRLASSFLRAEYDYAKRYLISAILRRDGSTRFGVNNRFGYFPSLSAAWVISDESFFNAGFIDFAKLRVSYGISGNDQIGDFRYRATLGGEGVYVFDDIITQGTAIGAAANPDLKWESTSQLNIGGDLTFSKYLDLTFNYFIKKTSDLLFQPDVSAILGTYGAGSYPPIVNGGDVKNQGIELDINFQNTTTSGLRYGVNYNFTYLHNEVTRVPDGFEFIPGAGFGVGGVTATRFQKDFPIGYFIGYETNGIFQSQAEIDNSEVVQEGAQPGDLRFVDQDGDGVINFNDDSDRTMIGSPIPDFTMGFNLNLGYKGLDFSANVYAAIGQEIIRNYERQQPYANLLAYNINRWTGEGSTDEYPRLTTGLTRNTTFSDFYVEDGSFVRLRNIQLGYSLPEKWLDGLGVKQLKLYVSANNLITLTRYMGFDPDVGSAGALSMGVDNGIYPQARVYMGGLNLKF